MQRPTYIKQFADEVGIVVIGRNEGKRLIGCLTSIDPTMIATVYVDSGSTDDSAAAAERLGATIVRLDAARPFTAARARNEGFATLRSFSPKIEFVQFVDGDCELDAHWLGTALAFLTQHSDTAVACGRRRERYPEASIYNWLCDVEWDTPTGEALACGGDSLVRVAAFEAVGGFRPQLIAGEEPEFCLRLRHTGWKILRLDAEMTTHDAAMMSFIQWWRRAVRSGQGYAEIRQLDAGSSIPLWRRQRARAIFWGGLVPSAILLGVVASPIAIVAALLYPLQVARIASRPGITRSRSWAYGLFMTLGHFAALQGMLMYYWRQFSGRTVKLQDYKQSG